MRSLLLFICPIVLYFQHYSHFSREPKERCHCDRAFHIDFRRDVRVYHVADPYIWHANGSTSNSQSQRLVQSCRRRERHYSAWSSALQQQVGCDCECEWLSSHHVVVDGARACAFSWLDFCTGAHRSGEQFRGPWGDPWVDIETRSEPAIIWVSKPENSWRKIGPDLESDRSQTRGSST